MVACSPFAWSSGGFVPLWLVVIVLTFCFGQRSVACSLPPQVYLEMPMRRDRLESRIRRNRKSKIKWPERTESSLQTVSWLERRGLSVYSCPSVRLRPRFQCPASECYVLLALVPFHTQPTPRFVWPPVQPWKRRLSNSETLRPSSQLHAIVTGLVVSPGCPGLCFMPIWFAHQGPALIYGSVDWTPPAAADPLNPPPAGPDAWAGSPLN